MFRKNYLIGFFTVALFLIGSVSAFAQTTAAIGGRIQLKGADGKLTPVEGALIEVFRIDIKSKFPSDKTDKKGQFSIAGLPLGAQFVISISGPGIKPVIQPGIKAGMEKIDIDVEPGDGQQYTEQEVRDAITAGSTPQSNELTAEQKKKQEELDKKRAEVTEKNAKIEAKNVAVKRALDEGMAAFDSKNYDVAITKFEEGFQADPEFVGSAPILLNAKAQALRLRAVSVYNAENGNKDVNAKVAALARVKADLAEAIEAYSKAFLIVKNAPAADVVDPKKNEQVRLDALRGTVETLRITSLTGQPDGTKLEVAKMMVTEYLSIESDQAKKVSAQRYLGDVLLASGDSENAIVEYKKVLAMSPNDPDALAGIGLSLVIIADLSGDKSKYQEAADYLQKFVDVAPSNHKLVESVKASIADLKASQNVAPTKGNTKKKN